MGLHVGERQKNSQASITQALLALITSGWVPGWVFETALGLSGQSGELGGLGIQKNFFTRKMGSRADLRDNFEITMASRVFRQSGHQ